MANKLTLLLVEELYPDFNARNIDKIMPHFTQDIDWPNGMTGGRELGKEAVREYWINQWKVINSQVTPISYRVADGKVVLEVQQSIKDIDGQTISGGIVFHTYSFENEKIVRMDISENVPGFAASLPANSI